MAVFLEKPSRLIAVGKNQIDEWFHGDPFPAKKSNQSKNKHYIYIYAGFSCWCSFTPTNQQEPQLLPKNTTTAMSGFSS